MCAIYDFFVILHTKTNKNDEEDIGNNHVFDVADGLSGVVGGTLCS